MLKTFGVGKVHLHVALLAGLLLCRYALQVFFSCQPSAPLSRHSAALREDHSEAMAEEASRVTARTVYKYTTPAVLSSLLLTQLNSYVDADACVSESLNCTTPQGFPEISLAPVCTYLAHCSPNIFFPAVGITTHQDAWTLQHCDLRLFFTLAVESVSLLSLNLI